jgi:serine/threonine protein phosphatase PrpC
MRDMGVEDNGSGLKVYAARCRGASHKREGKPCQDSFAIWNGIIDEKQISILVVADGHGGEKYDLSQYGSALAAEAAIDEIKKIYHKFSNSKNLLLRSLKYDFPDRVLRQWKAYILEDIKERENFDGVEINEKILKRYGTTVLIALVSPEGVFVGQLGDGNILIIENNGEVECPIISTDELIGNETYSMTTCDAPRLWNIKTYTVKEKALVVLSTDGLSNCFKNDNGFKKFAVSLYKNIEVYGFSKVTDDLPAWIEGASQMGSGDDITVALAIVDSNFIKI